ncbi:MAG: HNH endonuclease [Sphaerochaetaceae bacterium]|nr:HNH endonuclease [Sphaerochaetaceae bacterium]
MSKNEIRAAYWKYAEKTIRNTIPEIYRDASLNSGRSAFDSTSRKSEKMLITCIAGYRTSTVSVGIYFKNMDDPSGNKAKADLVLENKDSIRTKLSFPEVTIEPATGRKPKGERKVYSVLFSLNIDVLDKNNWEKCREFHSKTAREIYDLVLLKLLSLEESDRKHFESLNKDVSCDNNQNKQTYIDFFNLRALAISTGETYPQKVQTITSRFERNATIVEYAKRRANGICQLCEKPAPFYDSQRKPYLEVHHIDWLSEGGSDTISNTVALCPNCHRKMHICNDYSDVEKLKRIAEQDIQF